MKSIFMKVLCIVLAGAGIFAIMTASSVPGDVAMVKNYWLEQKEANAGKVDMIIDGIGLLAQNLDAYLEGAAQYAAGLEEYEQGKDKLDAGEDVLFTGQGQYDQGSQQLADAKLTYEDGLAQYEAGKIKLAEGKAQLEEGKKKLAEGKAKLAIVEPIYNLVMPVYEDYQKAQQKYDNAVAIYDEAVANGNLVAATAAQWAVNSAKDDLDKQRIYMSISLSGYTIETLISEYEAGAAEVAAGEIAVAEGEAQVAEGERQLAEAERQLADGRAQIDAGEQQLIQGKKELDSGYVEYWAGLEALAKGEQQLIDGNEQLTVFEDGEAQLIDGINLAMSMEGYGTQSGKVVIPAIKDRLDEDFSYWLTDSSGKQILARGNPVLDTDRAMDVAVAAKSFMSDIETTATSELISRYVFAGIAVIVAALCIAAATLGFIGNAEAAKKLARICAFFSIVSAAVKYIFYPEITMSIAAGSAMNGKLSLSLMLLAVCATLLYIVMSFSGEAQTSEA